ncbi:hypothetical protein WL04_01090 [Burkholderia ubonensis]|nr:hypothetical protein WM36_05860 [Burkholderia ubonensis]KVD32651.1 hypothetical protein WI83_16155 [Burkholderia ubonensis]KVO45961.1 hypothetical protein WJ77_02135 [Burkholderia ubonensis]KVX43589.1 hypothetical protein WL04_01090 [Burkholderia ubonensis]KWO49907.1 hypothetical protein WM30_03780 [Burkholderia ubonensis]
MQGVSQRNEVNVAVPCVDSGTLIPRRKLTFADEQFPKQAVSCLTGIATDSNPIPRRIGPISSVTVRVASGGNHKYENSPVISAFDAFLVHDGDYRWLYLLSAMCEQLSLHFPEATG